MKSRRVWSCLAVIAAGVLWGTIGIYIREFNKVGLETMNIVEARTAGTAVIMFLYLFFKDRNLLKIRWKDLWCFLGTGVLSIVFFTYCYYKTIILSDLSVAAILLYTAPAMVMVMSALLFRERFTKIKALALVLSFVGCVLVTGVIGVPGLHIFGADVIGASGAAAVTRIPLSAAAILTGLGAGFGYALYSIFSRFALERGYDSATISFYTFLCASIGALPFVDPGKIGHAIVHVQGGPLFYLAFVLSTTVFAYFLYTWGLQGIENGTASILASVEPVVATLVGVLLFQESLSATELCGVVLVLVSVMICNR